MWPKNGRKLSYLRIEFYLILSDPKNKRGLKMLKTAFATALGFFSLVSVASSSWADDRFYVSEVAVKTPSAYVELRSTTDSNRYELCINDSNLAAAMVILSTAYVQRIPVAVLFGEISRGSSRRPCVKAVSLR